MPEQEAFDEAVARCRGRLDPGDPSHHDVQDGAAPRRNVLHFFGMGGIGKSELLNRLRRHATGTEPKTTHWTPFAHVSDSVTAFYDFKRQLHPTPEGLLLTIRQELANAGVKCPAFDLLIASYWAVNHPGDSLQAYISRRSHLADVNDSVGMSKQIETSVGEVVTALLGVGVGVSGESMVRLARTAATAVANHGPRRTALRDCRRLQDLLRAPATPEALPFYATAMAWDLSRAKRRDGRTPLLIVFVDHVEEIDEHVELMLQQIVWLLPNALFVTSGRNFIRWGASGASGLFRSGPACWPLLVDGTVDEPRQHRIGPLSPSDATGFLRDALAGNALEDDELARVAAAAGGLPYHLDLMVQHWAGLQATRTPAACDLLVPFPDLARRVLRDLDFRERRLVFACTLFDRFDSSLLADVAGVDDGVARALLVKPLFQEVTRGSKDFSLDRTLRQMFLDLAEEGQDGWSSADWSRMARRAMSTALETFGRVPAGDQRFWLAQGLQIAIAFDLDAEPLVDLAALSVEGTGWDPSWRVDDLRPGRALGDGWAADFASALRLVFSRQSRPRDQVAGDLENLLMAHDDDPRFDLARYFAAEALRDAGQLYKAHRRFQQLIDDGSIYSARARHGRIHLLRREGKAAEALRLVEEGREDLPAPERLSGEILWTQARFAAAADAFRRGHELAKAAGRPGEQRMCGAYHAFAVAWERPDAAVMLLERYGDERVEHPSSFTEGLERLARFLCMTADESELRAAWQVGRADSHDLRQTSLTCYFDLCALFLARTGGFEPLAGDARSALSRSSRDGSILYLCDIADVIKGETGMISGSGWIDGEVGERWARAVSDRRSHLSQSGRGSRFTDASPGPTA